MISFEKVVEHNFEKNLDFLYFKCNLKVPNVTYHCVSFNQPSNIAAKNPIASVSR